MGILSGSLITEAVQRGDLRIDPFDASLAQPASYDLRLHEKVLASPLGPGTDARGQMHLLTEDAPAYNIQSGQMLAVMSLEHISIPLDLMCRFGIRSDFARRGLIAFGGLQLDPGWRGRLILYLLNVGPEPVRLHRHEPFFSIEFHRLEEATEAYSGPHQDQDDYSPEEVEYILSARTTSLAEIPAFRAQIEQLSVLIEDIADSLPDPDAGLLLKPDIDRRLRDSLRRPQEQLLDHSQMLGRLNL